MDFPVSSQWRCVIWSGTDIPTTERALTQTFSTKAPDQLSKFTKNFKDLKGSFFTGVAVQNALISHEVNNHVDKIGDWRYSFASVSCTDIVDQPASRL